LREIGQFCLEYTPSTHPGVLARIPDLATETCTTMPLFLIFLVAAVLVIALIKVLHASHLRKTRDIADQGMPLQPLVDLELSAAPAPRSTVTVAQALSASGHEPASWREDVKALRDAGRFQEALALCSRQYPRMLAFRQTMITLRSRMKSGEEEPAEALKDIYRTAIMASLSKASQEPLTESDIREKLPMLNDSRHYWNELGYRHLDLLTKTDCSLLIRHWGEPVRHNDINQLINPGK